MRWKQKYFADGPVERCSVVIETLPVVDSRLLDDFRSMEEMINEGDVDSLGFSSYQFGNTDLVLAENRIQNMGR